MNRRLTFAIGAIQALSAVAIGVGAIAVPLSILWIFEQDAQTGWLVAFRTAADLWLLSQGTPLDVAAGKFLTLDVPAFSITLIPLAYSIVLGWLAYRIGRRFSGAPEIWPAWTSALAAYADEIADKRSRSEWTVPTRLSRELATNPFLRADDPALQARWGGGTAIETFAALRSAKDNFR